MDGEMPEDFRDWILDNSRENPEEVVKTLEEVIQDNEEDMGFIHLTDSFKLGRLLGRLNTELQYRGPSTEVGEILQHLVIIEFHLMNPHVESDVLKHVRRRRRKISDDYPDSGEKIGEKDLNLLSDDCDYWEEAIKKEFKGEQRMPVLNKSLLDLEGLLESPNKFFKEDVWDWLDERPRKDLKEACRTLAIDSPTASVMLALRAVEYCLRKWYEKKTGKNFNSHGVEYYPL